MIGDYSNRMFVGAIIRRDRILLHAPAMTIRKPKEVRDAERRDKERDPC